MKRSGGWCWLVIVAALLRPGLAAQAAGRADHVVVVVWDGLRPDFVRPQYTPALFEFASKGTFFQHNHSAYVTSTEVNGTALSTGMQPDRSGIIANFQYRPDLSWLGSYGTETLDAVRRADLLTSGHYLEAPTIAEILQAQGMPTVVAGAKAVALLQDRAPKKVTQAQKDSVTLFRGQTLPRSVMDRLTKAPNIGPFPSNSIPTNALSALAAAGTNNPAAAPGSRRGGGGGGTGETVDSWTTKALTRGLWRQGVPKYTTLWLSEPDASQHEHGLGSDEAIAGLERSDANFALVLAALEEKGVLEHTDVFVVSDHGFSTISRGFDLVQALKHAKFTAGKQFQNPEPGDVMVVSLGGSCALYVFEHDETVIRHLVDFLQSTDFAGVIFSAMEVEGTFPLALAHLAPTNGAPDLVVSMRWNDDLNEHAVPGTVAASDGKRGQGTHASLSRFDLHNTLIARGPDFKPGFASELPSGNIDVAPTVLFLLGVTPPAQLDGRVLSEALVSDGPPVPKAKSQNFEASRDLGFLTWHQWLRTVQVGYATYYDEGNGQCAPK